MDNNKKCDKYEGLFLFRKEEELLEHIENCQDCKQEYEKHQKISSLVKEVAPVYLAKKEKEKNTFVRRVACCFVILTIVISFAGYKAYDNYSFQANMEEESCISNIGLPIDDYGFFEIN